MKYKIRSLLLLATLSLIVANSPVIAKSPKTALAPTLTITPTIAIPPEIVTFDGSGFVPGRLVSVTAEGPTTWHGGYPVDANGQFSIVWSDIYAWLPSGSYVVTAQQAGHPTAIAALTVE